MSGDTGLWQRAERLFEQALELDANEREAVVERECGADADLRRLVRELLDGHDKLERGFLEPPSGSALEGRRIGEFKLLRTLGQGGMGVVYEAEQDQPRRRVALKLVRSLPGTSHDARRLALEAETIARLSHPNIAQVYAAGSIDDPAGKLAWFAMELVEGAETLIEFARSRSLDREARLELFDSVCRAVHHGHQRGVIHCDLKPRNVLVDSGGTPKVIDFGIARVTSTERNAETLRGGTDFAGTLAYMSPEQASGVPGAVDTRSDVYSLGVTLYELLCDTKPLALAGRSITEALEVVRDVAPAAPRGLPADLATIVLVALAKEPADRYAGVAELAEDLRRFRASEPIVARPPSLAHRLALFARRRRALAALLVIAPPATPGKSTEVVPPQTYNLPVAGSTTAHVASSLPMPPRYVERSAGSIQSSRPAS